MTGPLPGVEREWLGRVPYRPTLARQRDRRAAVQSAQAPEVLWTLEHDPVITTGRRQVSDLDPQALSVAGVEVVATERGGLATWHGPGQLVGYLILDLRRHGLTVRGTVNALEQGVIDWLAGQGVLATRRDGYPGVWVGRGKLCALGLHFSKGVSMHGIALNLTADLSGFDRITPCGILDGEVTSLLRCKGDSPAPGQAAQGVSEALLHALARSRR